VTARAALYARYSSDLQNERSADDQLDALRRSAVARGMAVVAEFADRGVSGTALANRPEARRLLAEAAIGGFDILLVESLDRLSRGQSDAARMFELLEYYGVAIDTLNGQRVSELHIGLEGTMNRLFLKGLGDKTRRGVTARVEAGFSGGGRCYGYRTADKGVLVIVPEQAEVIRRIYTDYDRGLSPRTIAGALNAEGVLGPRGGTWVAAAINGDRRAGDGLLHQELYVGTRVFNRRRFRKHPETGRRTGVLNPPDQWLRKPVPELRILDDALWARVQARNADLSALPAHRARRPKRLLSGLLKCGPCGHGMTLKHDRHNRARYLCVKRRESGPSTCANGRTPAAEAVERRVIEGLQRHLLSPDAVARAVRVYQAELQTDQADVARELARAERDLAEVERRLRRAWEAFEDGGLDTAALTGRINELHARKGELEQTVAAARRKSDEAVAYRIHPRAAERWRDLVAQLTEVLAEPDAEEVRDALRGLIEEVRFMPGQAAGEFDLEVVGRISALLGVTEQGRGCALMMGAGTGLRSKVTPLVLSFAA
jgi:DNA invertase Pin-like site-specific DNA recombinase